MPIKQTISRTCKRRPMNKRQVMKRTWAKPLTPPHQLRCTYHWCKLTVCFPFCPAHTNSDQSIIERKRAGNVAALAVELNMPQLPNILCCFLHSQLRPTDPRNPEDVPLDECLLHDGKIHIYNSACSTFFVLSHTKQVWYSEHGR